MTIIYQEQYQLLKRLIEQKKLLCETKHGNIIIVTKKEQTEEQKWENQ